MKVTNEDFKAARIKLGLTQNEWADVLGVSYSSVTKWEMKGAKPIPAYVANLIENMRFGEVTLKLDEEEMKRLASHLIKTGKDLETYVSDLVRAAI